MGKGRAPCCDKSQVKRGPWSPAEDLRLITFIQKNGHENWRALPKQAGLLRCGKSCRLRWINYLRPDLKRGNFTQEEEDTVIKLHDALGNKWSKIASYLPGRTDNEIKNVWNTHLKKKIKPNSDQSKESSSTSSSTSSLSTASNHNSREKRRVETELLDDEHQWDKCHMPKKLRESSDVAEDQSDQTIKDMSRSSSFSSNNSSSVTNSSQVDHNHDHDATIRSEDDHRVDSFFEFSEVPHGFGINTLEEVNKPEIVPNNKNDDNININEFEIPLEADLDFWDMLDCLSGSFQSNPISSLEVSSNINNTKEEVDNRKWFQYLENELGLEATEYHNQEKYSTKESEPLIRAETCEIQQKPELDPGMSYFQPWPSSPPTPQNPVP